MSRRRAPRPPAAPALRIRRAARASFDLTTAAGIEAFQAHWDTLEVPTPLDVVLQSIAEVRQEFEAALARPDVHGTHEPARRGLRAVDWVEKVAPRLTDDALVVVSEAMHAIESLWILRGNALFSEAVDHARRSVAQAKEVAALGGRARAGTGAKRQAVESALRAYRGPARRRTSFVAEQTNADPSYVRKVLKSM